MTKNLARVHWQMGQTLLPEHLLAQEEALVAEGVAHLRALGLPHHGVGALEWNEGLLSTGVLSLRALTVVFPSGRLVDVPGNSRVGPLNLNGPGTAEVSAYLHLLDGESEADAEPDETGVARRLLTLTLSSNPEQPGALETLRLGVFKREPDGAWRPGEAYLPPLLLVGASPFLRGPLAAVLEALAGFESQLRQEALGPLGAASLSGQKMCLRGLYRLRRLLLAARGAVRFHPYHVYEALRDFYLDVCLYREVTPRNGEDVYDHDDLGRLFARVMEPLKDQLGLAGRRSPYLPFERCEGTFRLNLPREYRGAREVYLLVQKPGPSRSVSLEGLKMAALSRLHLVHQLALQGIALTRVDRPVAAHAFGPEVEFYLMRQGEEWDHALREGTAAFFDAPEFADLAFFLYGREG